MAVAPLDIEEGRLVECLNGLSVTLLKGDGDKRFDSCGWPFIVPGEGEDKAFVPYDLAIDTAEPILAMLGRLDHPAIGAADAEVDHRLGAGEILRAHPALHVLGF